MSVNQNSLLGTYRASILIVDDIAYNLQLLSRILTQSGYKVHKATNGTEALTLISQSLPDLILLDIRMPGMSGIEVCLQLKKISTQIRSLSFLLAQLIMNWIN